MKKQWRSLGQLSGAESFKRFLHREFQEGASVMEDSVTRRNFLKIMGASASLAGVMGCSIRRPVQTIRPFAKMPEYALPGKAVYYATSMSLGDDVVGLLVKSQQGRPTKIEGNPDHPGNKGKTTVYNQASILDLYDPDRVKSPSIEGKRVSRSDFYRWFDVLLKGASVNDGYEFCILTQSQMSPTFFRLLKQARRQFPKLKTFRYDPINKDAVHHGLFSASGKWMSPVYSFKDVNTIVSFDSDFLGNETDRLSSVADFSSRRDPKGRMNRLYVFESQFTQTGSRADHRYAISRSKIPSILIRLADILVEKRALNLPASLDRVLKQSRDAAPEVDDFVLRSMATDLIDNKGRSLLLAGSSQPEYVHALIYFINRDLRNNNRTVFYKPLRFSDDSLTRKRSLDSISELSGSMRNGEVKTLLILGGNPVYDTPHDSGFSDALSKVENVLHLTLRENETSRASKWVVGLSHYLESWGDAVAVNGTTSIVQPLVRPLYDTVSEIELLARFSSKRASGYAEVRKTWRDVLRRDGFESNWKRVLHNGVLNGRGFEALELPYRSSYLTSSAFISDVREGLSLAKQSTGLELVFSVDSTLYDGRFANNGWLQELPDPVSKLTWDNAAYVGVQTAAKLGLETGDMVEIKLKDTVLSIAAMVLPGVADNTVVLPLGYGAEVVGRVGDNAGFNVYPMRRSDSLFFALGATVSKTGETYVLASTQDHGSMEGRPLYREATLSEYHKSPDFASKMGEPVPESSIRSAYPEVKYDTGYQWGMVIDLNKCTSCNACVISCQAENNIPIVGKEEVEMGREMQWIRLDRYFLGEKESPEMVTQPMTCLQCENAPCEQVCPAAATVHDDEGLNAMVYNRCIGTRYCLDNCPTKVRRFNFFDYHQRNPQSVKKKRDHLFDLIREPDLSLQMQFNPDVTVRMRGVMEKCTFCVQRINASKQQVKNEGRVLRDGEIKTACQQACPADAIVFGDILDKKSRVAQLRASQLNYSILEQLNLKARTTYLGAVRNPNPKIEKWKLKTMKGRKSSSHRGHG